MIKKIAVSKELNAVSGGMLMKEHHAYNDGTEATTEQEINNPNQIYYGLKELFYDRGLRGGFGSLMSERNIARRPLTNQTTTVDFTFSFSQQDLEAIRQRGMRFPSSRRR